MMHSRTALPYSDASLLVWASHLEGSNLETGAISLQLTLHQTFLLLRQLTHDMSVMRRSSERSLKPALADIGHERMTTGVTAASRRLSGCIDCLKMIATFQIGALIMHRFRDALELFLLLLLNDVVFPLASNDILMQIWRVEFMIWSLVVR